MLEQTLNKIAEQILGFDEASLVSLWDRYRQRMEKVEISRDWERSVIVFFIINAVRAKNQIFNEAILSLQNKEPASPTRPQKPKSHLRLIKTDE